MGSTGFSIELERIEGRPPQPWSAVRKATLAFLSDQWGDMLSVPMRKLAWKWVSLGEDSLLTLGDPGQPADEPVHRITFWFYLSVEWPSELADHWLRMALASERERFEADLAELGYRVAKGSSYPRLNERRHAFVMHEGRIGLPSEDGVVWGLPSYESQPRAALPPKAVAKLDEVLGGGRCQCPFCVRLRLAEPEDADDDDGAEPTPAAAQTTAKKQPTAKKTTTAKKQPTAKKTTTAKKTSTAKKK